ncbi:MAG: site-specific integrase [Bryobacterales bacterium]|nr:site-specific integrase [Bryobacterales bacterium]
MPRDRHQNGYVEETGKRTKKWKGHYYVYVAQPDGSEKRAHRAAILGLKSQMKKWEAEKLLQQIIDKATDDPAKAKPSSVYRLKWFWENRYKPIKESTWKVSSRKRTVGFIENYVIGPFGEKTLAELNRFDLQTHLNKLAEDFSHSVVSKFRVYVKAILDEAIEQDFIAKNPARKLSMPETRKVCQRRLDPDEIAAIVGQLSQRDRLVIRMFLVLGLRPGEMFVLRRNDKLPGQLRIDESVSPDRLIVEPKSEASTSYVWLPQSLETELDFWLEAQTNQRPDAFMFPTRNGTPLNVCNYLNEVVKPAAACALKEARAKGPVPAGFLEGVNHQAFRRTCATYMQKHGTVKDVQAHLRHASATTTVGVYMKEIPASVRAAVEELDRVLSVPAEQSGAVN